jgi:ribosomal small subunit protein bTHX
MGKGDKRTTKGKRYRGTYGKTRPKKGKRRKQALKGTDANKGG